MVSSKNNAANVSAAKGVAGGYFFRAPVGSTKPTDIKAPLDAAFKCCGFIGEDGFGFETETDSEALVDMNGEEMDSTKKGHSETFTVVFAEAKAMTFETMYGSKNVSDKSGVIKVEVTDDDPEHYIWVAELVLKNGRRWRRLIHDAKVDEMGGLKVASSDLMARECTMKAFKNPETNSFYTDWYDSTETQGA